jgi:hypothetical protein
MCFVGAVVTLILYSGGVLLNFSCITGYPEFFMIFLSLYSEGQDCTLKYATNASSQIVTYSSFTIIFPSHPKLYNLYGWNSIIK